MLKRGKRGVFILECLDQDDPGSEGRFLAHMFRLMRVRHQYLEVRSRDQFLAFLLRSPYEIIHITTHGSVTERAKEKRFSGLWFPDGEVRVADFSCLNGCLRGHSLVMTACLSGQREVARALVRNGHCAYVVGPIGSPTFHNSIFFAHVLYHHYFINKRSLSEILERYDSRYKNPHQFVGIPLSSYGLHFVPHQQDGVPARRAKVKLKTGAHRNAT